MRNSMYDEDSESNEERGDMSTTSSDGELMASVSTKSEPFMLIYSIQDNGKSLFVNISTNRIKTKFGKKQADHVTAYRVFSTLIYTSIVNKTVENALDYLCKVASSYLPEQSQRKMENLYNECKEKVQEKTIDQQERKQITKTLRSLLQIANSTNPSTLNNQTINDLFQEVKQNLSSEKIEGIKYSLKHTLTATRALYLQKITRLILTETNTLKDMVFATSESNNNKQSENSKAGQEIKAAVKALSGIDRLIWLTSKEKDGMEDEKTDYEKEFFTQEEKGDEFYYANGVKKFIEECCNKEMLSPTRDLTPILKRNHKKTLELLPYTAQYIKKSIKHPKSELIMASISAKFILNLYDYKYEKNKKDVPTLVKTSARHIVMLFHSFKNFFSCFSKKGREKIIDLFLEGVYESQNWKTKTHDDEKKPSKSFQKRKFTIENYKKDTKSILGSEWLSLKTPSTNQFHTIITKENNNDTIFSK